MDFVNTALTVEVFSQGMPLKTFMKRVDEFIKSNASTATRHREFVKVL